LAAIPGTSRWEQAVAKLTALGGAIQPEGGGEPAATLSAAGSRRPAAAPPGGVSRLRRRVRAASGDLIKEVLLPTAEPQLPERAAASLAVVRDPYGRAAEAYRVLKSSLEFANLEHDFKSLLVTSARPYRGKSEMVANLAVTRIQSGRRVLVCDLDARRPSISDLFGLDGRPGMREVAMGRCSLEEAIVSIPRASLLPPGRIVRGGLTKGELNVSGSSTTGSSKRGSSKSGSSENGFSGGHDLGQDLRVLPFGDPPPDSGFLGTRAVTELVEALRSAHADLVLIDAPPLLVSGEAQTLSAVADALVVALADPVRPSILADLAATLSRLPARPLGFVSVGVGRESGERYAGRHGDRTPEELERLLPPANGHGGQLSVRDGFTAMQGLGPQRSDRR
jgi:Mrp family chromosome partitioning ATPase